jgi:TPR repeat protein
LGISSVAAAPILIAGKVAGLVEVFSGHPNAFNEDSCSTLQALAASVAVSVQMHAALQVATSEPGTGLAKAPEAAAPLSETPPAAPSATGTEATVEPEPQDSAAPGPYERLTAAAAAAAVAAPAAESASVPAAIEEVAPASGQLHSNTAAVTEPELEPSPDPATLASEFGAAPVGEPEGGSDVRRRLALILPIVALFLLGIVFLLVRGGRPTKTSELAAPVLPDVSAKPSSMARTVPGASLSNIKAQAERGDANAEFELGAKYASGEDVKQSYPQAVKWFTKAADQGHVLAAATLGAFYWAGRGLPQDYVSAYMWSAIAKEGGDEASKYRVAILGSRMSAGEVNEAQRRATEWLQRHPKFVASKMSPAQPQ